MRRAIAIVLLLLLPLQFSWAAMDSYGESEVRTEHTGHLDHHHSLHPASAAADLSFDTGADPVDDADCGQCHVHCHCIGMLPVAKGIAADPSTASCQACAHPVAASVAATRPERPQWAALA